MIKYVNAFQTLVIKTIIVLMVVVILSSTLEVGWIILRGLITPPFFFLNVEKVLDIFGLFFLVIIGIELLETIKMIITESTMNVGVIILVGITAIVRKVIIIDLKTTAPLFLMGLGVLVFSLAGAYYLINISGKEFKCELK
ncbi:MAG: phosphate-starvation-inducible PsiE family protein [Methanomethylovorans sp.]|uniref:phosphate-starvation-inducible PsiE family protein n=1 Tax=Methanomethylovorans sp. TaxID=2758717 RepID=UPI003530BCB1